MNTKRTVVLQTKFHSKEFHVKNGVAFHVEAELAERLMHHFGSVAGIPDGEDSAGRSIVRLQTPVELVERCCRIAAIAMEEFEKRGWLLELPDMPPEDERPKKSE